jgi:thioredoxin reductase (NADPH)
VAILDGRDNVRIITSATVKAIISEEGEFRGITLNTKEGEKELTVDGMFVAIGQIPECEAFSDVVSLSEYGYIEAAEDCVPHSALAGVFVAGDCRTKSIRQVATATSDGTIAALAAVRYIDSIRR